ncbi:hypothetical protein [Devosia sp.]|uniref:MotE family protein n=1 Tax=Devosia sp. TaxID=1871048 RepID=UPI0025FB22AA|nr:hypothetical protein [Devosia sp.]MCR6634755.1 hypothetical protein [Devosia sp.]
MFVTQKVSLAVLVLLVFSAPVLAVQKAGSGAEGGEGAAVSIGGSTLGDAAPVIEDATPTLALSDPEAGLIEGAETNSIVGAAALSPDRCSLALELPADGEKIATPKVAEAGAEKECVERVDAVPMMMTSSGVVPLTSTDTGSATADALLLRLGERNKSLEDQKASLDKQALLLDAAEKRIAERIAKLTELEAGINELAGTRDRQSQQKIDEMVSLYQNMKPKDAAAVMSGLPNEVLLKIASSISPRKMSAIMAEMDTTRAQTLTVLLIDQTATAQP